MSDLEGDDRNKAWALVRFLLGLAQMMGAVMGAYLLVTTGMNELSLGIVLSTCVCTTISVFLFGDWRGRKR
jgi:hypothetical protein